MSTTFSFGGGSVADSFSRRSFGSLISDVDAFLIRMWLPPLLHIFRIFGFQYNKEVEVAQKSMDT